MIPIIPLEAAVTIDNNNNNVDEMSQGPKLYITTNLNGDDTIFEVFQMQSDSNFALERSLELTYGGIVRTCILYGNEIYKLEDIDVRMLNESEFLHALHRNVRLLIYVPTVSLRIKNKIIR
ncbi:hypothetical protein GCK72_025433 [Caenorhabditis remanei]|uniref:Uncharacterized protein n=1 Tax=Caenorhabditis remanei TaxID=31234 RepID=A0A6A5G1Z9_CAERE|nr:hypothetical protein GCK72_025433 [Caenorhabditis remanei]KAF1748966.1 hypothetical protein GCK72_025433 [Caenorhabditis remanei]